MTKENMLIMYNSIVPDNYVINKMYNEVHSNWMIGALLAVFVVVFRIFFYSLVIYLGFYLYDKQQFLPIFEVVVISDVINVIAALIKNINLIFFNSPTDYYEMTVVPFSLTSFFDVHKIEPWILVPLNAANLFEIAYIFLMTYLISKKMKYSFGDSFKIVIGTYGLLALLITVVYTFMIVYVTK